MKNNQSSDGFEAMQQVFGVFAPLRAAWGENWTNYWRSQDKVLDSMHEFSRGWFERRHEAARTALDACQRSCEATSPAEVMREFQAWMTASMQRVAADGLACQRHLMAVAELSAPAAASGGAQDIKVSPPASVRRGTVEPAKAA